MLEAGKNAILRTGLKLLPPPASAWLRYVQGDRNYFDPFGSAMNGQTARLETTRRMIFRCGIRQIVETGTYRGTTTEWLAGFGVPVLTIESNARAYHFAKLRLGSYGNVHVQLGSSVEVLQNHARSLDPKVPTLFYLDAHWEDYLPLRDEMLIILPRFAAAVILIDDFEVPGETGYGYDDYGPGKVLNAAYLQSCLQGKVSVFYPSTPAAQETGKRRGWVVVTPNPEMEQRLSGVELMRRAATHDVAGV